MTMVDEDDDVGNGDDGDGVENEEVDGTNDNDDTDDDSDDGDDDVDGDHNNSHGNFHSIDKDNGSLHNIIISGI